MVAPVNYSIMFYDLNVDDANKPECKEKAYIQKYDEIFNAKIESFKQLIQRLNEPVINQIQSENLDDSPKKPELNEIWSETLDNISQVKFLSEEYEKKIFEQFPMKNDELKVRYSRLIHNYKQLRAFYEPSYKSEDITRSIEKLTQQIIVCQEKLYKEFPSDHEINIPLRKLYRKTMKYILNQMHQNALTNPIIAIWNKQKLNPMNKLRCQINALATISDSMQHLSINQDMEQPKQSDLSFDFIMGNKNFKEISGKGFDSKKDKNKIKKLYEIFSFIFFNEKQEERIFLELAQTKSPERLQLNYKFFCLKRYCKKLIALHRAKIDYEELLEQIKEILKFLGCKYSSGDLKKNKWDKVFKIIENHDIPIKIKKPILELFLEYKKPAAPSSYLYNIMQLPLNLLSKLRSSVEDGEQIWKGNKYKLILESTKKWIEDNELSISSNLKEDQDNPVLLKSQVQEILNFFKEMKCPKIERESSHEQRKSYNQELRIMCRNYVSLLRKALTNPQCILAFERYSFLGAEKTSGCALILMDLCRHRFRGINMLPFIVELIKDMIDIGLTQLAADDTNYRLYLNREIYPNPLEIGSEIIHTAIENVPDKFKAPFLSLLGWKIRNAANLNWDPHKQGTPNINLLEMTFCNQGLSTKKVKFLRFATPTNSTGVIPEFLGSIKDERVLLCSLQSSDDGAEATRTDSLFALNSSQIFVAAYPVNNSDLFQQVGEFAANFNAKTFFFNAIMQKIVPKSDDQKPFGTGNYLFPKSWVDSDKFKKMVENSLAETHEIFFGETEIQKLNPSQRSSFIKFFDVVLAFKLIHYTNCDTFAFLCNHSADRTGVFVTLTLEILIIMFKKANKPIDETQLNSPTWMHVLEALKEGIPMINAKREMNDYHIGLVEARKILQDKEVGKRLRKNRANVFGIANFEFPFAGKTLNVSKDPNNNNTK